MLIIWNDRRILFVIGARERKFPLHFCFRRFHSFSSIWPWPAFNLRQAAFKLLSKLGDDFYSLHVRRGDKGTEKKLKLFSNFLHFFKLKEFCNFLLLIKTPDRPTFLFDWKIRFLSILLFTWLQMKYKKHAHVFFLCVHSLSLSSFFVSVIQKNFFNLFILIGVLFILCSFPSCCASFVCTTAIKFSRWKKWFAPPIRGSVPMRRNATLKRFTIWPTRRDTALASFTASTPKRATMWCTLGAPNFSSRARRFRRRQALHCSKKILLHGWVCQTLYQAPTGKQ